VEKAPQESAFTLAEVIAALKGASLVREGEVGTSAEAAARGLAGLPAGLWDRLRRALFTRIRLGRREKPLGQILREVNWVDRQELDQAEAEVLATGAPLGKLLLDRGLISPETLKTARRIQEETGEPL
jgi:hypothetical protein